MKKVLRWGILAAAIAFLIHNLMVHWGEVTHLRLRPGGLAMLALAFGVTLLAHTLSGWVWSWILDSLQHPISGLWSTLVYLRTNVWKYLPGNVWHFVGRVRALKTLTIPTGTAVAGVVLEPVLMAGSGPDAGAVKFASISPGAARGSGGFAGAAPSPLLKPGHRSAEPGQSPVSGGNYYRAH